MKNKLLFWIITVIMVSTACSKSSSSSGISPNTVNNIVNTGSWRVTYYWDSNTDETSNFSGYAFTFGSGNTVRAEKTGTTVIGNWTTSFSDDSKTKLILAFSSPADFVDISDDWQVLEANATKIRLQDVSGGGSGTDYLTFEKN